MTVRSRVLVVGMYYAPEPTGIAPYTTSMCRHFAEQGHDVTVVTGVPHYPQWKVADGHRRPVSTEVIDDVKVVRLRHYVPSAQSAITRAFYEASWLAPALPQMLRHRPDVVLAVTPPLAALPLARAAANASRSPWGVVLQDFMGKGAAQAGTPGGARVADLVDRVERSHLSAADRVAVIGPGFRDAVIDMGVKPENIDVVPNWTHVKPSKLTRNEARAALGWAHDEFLVIHTGNMGYKQGLENVVEAAKEADERKAPVTFLLVGDGNQREELQRDAEGIERIRFLPPVDAKEYPLVLAAADVLLVNERPGMVDMSLPSKVTSYLGAGRAVLAAIPPQGGTSRMLAQTGAAEIVPAGDPASLVDAAVRLAGDEAARVALAERGTFHAETEFAESAALARYDAFLEKLLQR